MIGERLSGNGIAVSGGVLRMKDNLQQIPGL